jgi:hypothetical protein
MEGEKLFVSERQLHKWRIMGLVEVGKITVKEAGEKIGVSYRQAKRIRRVSRDKGVEGIIHGNTGRPSHRCLDEELRQRVLAWVPLGVRSTLPMGVRSTLLAFPLLPLNFF